MGKKYRVEDYIGQKFGHLTVKGVDEETGWWIFQCDCGNTRLSTPYKVISGERKSCGCIYGVPLNKIDNGAEKTGLVEKVKCIVCGKEIQNVNKQTRYCPECKEKHRMEYGKRYREGMKSLAEIAKMREANKPKDERKKLSLKEISELAANEHLTYGAYVAKYGL